MAAFLDTNVVIYAVDRNEPRKRDVARAVMASEPDDLVISTQVLSEFFWGVTRRIADPLAEDVAIRLVGRLSRLRVVGADAPFVTSAIELARRHRLALWDALIVRAAQVAGCERLLTEDLHEGTRYGDVLVVNPFGEARITE